MSAQSSLEALVPVPKAAEGASNLPGRKTRARVVQRLLFLATSLAIVILAALILDISRSGLPWMSMDLLTNTPSRKAEQAGLRPALLGTIWVIGFTALFALAQSL